MTRKEEIWQAALILPNGIPDDFVKGAEWADSHPRKGLVDIEKVCEWLQENVTYTHPRKDTKECIVNLNALRDAMEE